MNKEQDYLHVYAQSHQHDIAVIVGTQNALLRLKELIEATLRVNKKKQEASCVNDFFVNDGEGYQLVIRRVANLDDKPMPYTDAW